MKRLFFGKGGADKILSVYWFAILFIVVVGIVYIAYAFYGEPYDVREIEADILINKIADCLSKGGILIGGFESLDKNNFLEICDLTFDVEDTNGWEDDQFFVSVEFTNILEDKVENSFSVGNFVLEDFCGTNLVVCSERKMYSLNSEGNSYSVKIKSVVDKSEKNVKK